MIAMAAPTRHSPGRHGRAGGMGAAAERLSRILQGDVVPGASDIAWQRFHDPAEPMFLLGAYVEGKLTGIVQYLFHRSSWTPGNYCYLQDLFVSDTARGHGARPRADRGGLCQGQGGRRQPRPLADADHQCAGADFVRSGRGRFWHSRSIGKYSDRRFGAMRKHRTMMCYCTSEKFEIPVRRFATPRNDNKKRKNGSEHV